MKKAKFFFFGCLIGFILLISWIKSLTFGNLQIVFCDVGQGDAIYIKFPDGEDALIDGGSNSKVLNCLGKHMAFWDRKIELVVLTHPQADHLNGLLDVFKRYEVDLFLAPLVGNKTIGYRDLKSLVKEKGIKVKNIYAGEKIQIKNTKLAVLWPEREWVANMVQTDKRSYTRHTRAELLGTFKQGVLGAKTSHSDLNDFSIVLQISYGRFDVLLTGDAGKEILKKALLTENQVYNKNTIEVLKIPHHGSGSGGWELLGKLRPALSVISVGKNNRYKHPSKKVIETLNALKIKTLRTDIDGEIEVISDGKVWKVIKGKNE